MIRFRANIFLNRLFLEQFRCTAKLSGRHGDLSHTPSTHTCVISSIINTPHQSSLFVTLEEPTLTPHHHTVNGLDETAS